MSPAYDDAAVSRLVDGELAADAAADIRRAAESDADLAARIKAAEALRAAVTGAFADALDEAPPERLVRAARGDGQVVAFAPARIRRDGASHRGAWWTAMAASVAAAFLLGRVVTGVGAPELVAGPGGLAARGALAAGLQNTLAASQVPGGAVRIGISFLAADGRYCRTFTLGGRAAVAGLACRGPTGWTVPMAMAAPATAAEGQYRTASSSTPAPILDLAGRMMTGEPLDAAGETSARAAGWRSAPPH